MARKIEIEIVGDTKNFQSALGKASGSADSFGSSLGKMAKYGALAIGAAGIGGLAVVLKQGIAEFSEASKVGAQTNAVLKSTGQAANVTAKEVSGLASSLMQKSGVDDEAIQSGENMLLTFTRIRNETGKGNDVFNQATKATLDLSVAMGKDMTSSAILVGKALNDPVKGMTALSKAGIQFTADQKTAIAAMVESGNVMGAQKLILAELTTQFGGSAEAIGSTLPGQLNILKESFNNLAGELVSGLAPAFTTVVAGLGDFVGKLSNAEGAGAKFGVVVDAVGTVAGKVGNLIRSAWNAIDWGALGAALAEGARRAFDMLAGVDYAGIAKTVGGKLLDALRTAFNAVDWNALGKKVGDLLVDALNRLSTFLGQVNWNAVGAAIVTGMGKAIAALASFLAGVDWPKVLSAIGKGIIAVLLALGGVVTGAAQVLGGKIISGLGQGLGNLQGWVADKLKALPDALTGMIGTVSNLAVTLGKAIVQGMISGIQSLVGSLVQTAKDMAMAPINAAKGILDIGSPSGVFAGIGADTIAGFVLGITQNEPKLTGKMAEAVSNALQAAKARVEAQQGALGEAFGNLGEFVARQFEAKTEQILDKITAKFDKAIGKWQAYADAATPAEKELARIADEEAKRARDAAVASAAAQLVAAEALEEGVEKERAVAAAKEAIRQASLSQQVAALEATAAVERAAREKTAAEHIAKLEETKARELQNLEERRSQLGTKLDEQLAVLAERLSKHPEEYDKIQKKINALLASYGVPMQKSGENLGKAFARGIRDARDEVEKAALSLAKVLQDILKLKSPAKRGPLSSLDSWFKPLGPMLAKQMNVGAVGGAAMGMAGAAATGGMRASTGSGSGSGQPIILQVQLDGRTIAEATYPHNLAVDKNRGGRMFNHTAPVLS